MIPHDFWMAVGTEIDRILSSNSILMISENECQNNQANNELEWPELPQMYRTQANVAFDQLARTGNLQSIPVTTEVRNAIRQTSRELISTARIP